MSDHGPIERKEHNAFVYADEPAEQTAPEEQTPLWNRLTRRRFIAASGAAGVAVTAVTFPKAIAQDTNPSATPADSPDEVVTQAAGSGDETDHAGMEMQPAPNTNAGFTFFVPYQAAIVQAAAARLIPTDDLGPGATEANVVAFIDRQLAPTERGYRGPRYNSGPFRQGEPTQGDQLGMAMRDRFRLGIFGLDAHAQTAYGAPFVQLAPEQQDQALSDLEQGIPDPFALSALQTPPPGVSSGAVEQTTVAGIGAKAFFDLLLAYTIAGFFADPVQGGNRDMVGWKLIGFPGAHVGYPEEILNYGVPFTGDFISLGQYQQQITGGA